MGRPEKTRIQPGDIFGYLTVTEYLGRKNKQKLFKCRCVCRKVKIFTRRNLASGDNKSCGCKRFAGRTVDLNGKVFGRWTVLERQLPYTGAVRWKCRCICGKERPVFADSLKTGQSTSCGCKRKETYQATVRKKRCNKILGGVPIYYLTRIRNDAKGRKIPFHLTLKDLADQYEKQNRKCYFTGLPVEFDIANLCAEQRHTASVDRLDSDGAYVASNIAIVHKDINRMKNAFPHDLFIHYCRCIAATHPKPADTA